MNTAFSQPREIMVNQLMLINGLKMAALFGGSGAVGLIAEAVTENTGIALNVVWALISVAAVGGFTVGALLTKIAFTQADLKRGQNEILQNQAVKLEHDRKKDELIDGLLEKINRIETKELKINPSKSHEF